MKKVRKAVIPAAGLGTRVLPATKVMPKEMLPIVDKPAIQYIVEEAAASGIEDILIITNRGKGLLEDHFDRAPELERRLAGDPAKEAILNQVVGISKLANIFYVRQKETKGLGHAIGCAREFVGDEPFAVLYGDDVILGEDPACGQLMRAYEQFGSGVVGVKEVSRREGTESTSGREVKIGKLKSTSSKRDVPLNQAALDAILDLRAERYFGEDSPLISDEHGDYTRPVNFRKRYYRILEAAGLEQRGLHALRHTFATNLVNGVKQPDGTIRSLSPRQVADLLGHSTSEITELYYVKKDTSRLAGITAGFDL